MTPNQKYQVRKIIEMMESLDFRNEFGIDEVITELKKLCNEDTADTAGDPGEITGAGV